MSVYTVSTQRTFVKVPDRCTGGRSEDKKMVLFVSVWMVLLNLLVYGEAGFTFFKGSSLSKNINIYCVNNLCGNMSYSDMYARYPGLFITMEELRTNEQLAQVNRQKTLRNQGYNLQSSTRVPGDGDACCATEIEFTHNVTMENIHGDTRTIVHMVDGHPPRYQFIPHASCASYGECKGECYLEPGYLSLLVYDEGSLLWPPLTFDWFQVPGYCSCKNV